MIAENIFTKHTQERQSYATPTKLWCVPLQLLQKHDSFPHNAAILFSCTQIHTQTMMTTYFVANRIK